MRLLLFILLLPALCNGAEDPARYLQEDSAAMEALARAQELIVKEAFEQKNVGQLTAAAIKGMLASLDPYSQLLTRKDYEKLQQESLGRYVGLGLNIIFKKGQFQIARVYKNSPGEHAGIKRGDVITHLNDKKLMLGPGGMDPWQQILPKKGKLVKLKVLRDTKSFAVKIRMAEIAFSSTQFIEIEPGLHLVELSDFTKKSAQEITDYLKGKKLQGMILDLRNNPGGLLFSAIEVAELFLKQGLIVKVKNQGGKVLESYSSKGFSTLQPFPLAILINQETASAAEILAGSLKDHRRARIFGEKSYGKGSIQSLFKLNDDLYVKMTMARYYTASGKTPHQVGIKPHEAIEENLKAPLYGKGDQIHQRAIQWLKKKL